MKVSVRFVHLAVSITSSDSTFLLSLYFRFPSSVQMGRFQKLVKTPAAMEAFRAKYHIPPGVGLQYCPLEGVLTDRGEGEVVIPMIAFIEGGMTLPMRRITREYLSNHRLTPYQCAPNMFKILGCVDVLDERMNLGLTWHDVAYLYECHRLGDDGYYLKSRNEDVRLISCLPISNKTVKNDFLIASREWFDGIHCPTRIGNPGAESLGPVLFGKGFSIEGSFFSLSL